MAMLGPWSQTDDQMDKKVNLPLLDAYGEDPYQQQQQQRSSSLQRLPHPPRARSVEPGMMASTKKRGGVAESAHYSGSGGGRLRFGTPQANHVGSKPPPGANLGKTSSVLQRQGGKPRVARPWGYRRADQLNSQTQQSTPGIRPTMAWSATPEKDVENVISTKKSEKSRSIVSFGSRKKELALGKPPEFSAPATRSDALKLEEWLEMKMDDLAKRQHDVSAMVEEAKRIYGTAFKEIIAQEATHCGDRARVMERIWKAHGNLLLWKLRSALKESGYQKLSHKREVERREKLLDEGIEQMDSTLRHSEAEITEFAHANKTLEENLGRMSAIICQIEDRYEMVEDNLKIDCSEILDDLQDEEEVKKSIEGMIGKTETVKEELSGEAKKMGELVVKTKTRFETAYNDMKNKLTKVERGKIQAEDAMEILREAIAEQDADMDQVSKRLNEERSARFEAENALYRTSEKLRSVDAQLEHAHQEIADIKGIKGSMEELMVQEAKMKLAFVSRAAANAAKEMMWKEEKKGIEAKYDSNRSELAKLKDLHKQTSAALMKKEMSLKRSKARVQQLEQASYETQRRTEGRVVELKEQLQFEESRRLESDEMRLQAVVSVEDEMKSKYSKAMKDAENLKKQTLAEQETALTQATNSEAAAAEREMIARKEAEEVRLRLEGRIAQIETELNHAREEAQVAVDKHSTLMVQMKEKGIEIQESKAAEEMLRSSAKAASELPQIQKELAEEKERNADLHRQINRLEHEQFENASDLSDPDPSMSNDMVKMHNKVKALEKQLAKEKQKPQREPTAEQLRKSKGKLLEAMKRKVAVAESQTEAVNKRLSSKQSQLDSMEKKLHIAQEQREAAQKESLHKDTKITQLKAKHAAQLSHKMSELQGSVSTSYENAQSDMEQELKELVESLTEHAQKNEADQQQIKTLQDDIENLTTNQLNLTEDVKLANDEKEQMQIKYKESEEKIETLNETLENYENHILDLSEELEETRMMIPMGEEENESDSEKIQEDKPKTPMKPRTPTPKVVYKTKIVVKEKVVIKEKIIKVDENGNVISEKEQEVVETPVKQPSGGFEGQMEEFETEESEEPLHSMPDIDKTAQLKRVQRELENTRQTISDQAQEAEAFQELYDQLESQRDEINKENEGLNTKVQGLEDSHADLDRQNMILTTELEEARMLVAKHEAALLKVKENAALQAKASLESTSAAQIDKETLREQVIAAEEAKREVTEKEALIIALQEEIDVLNESNQQQKELNLCLDEQRAERDEINEVLRKEVEMTTAELLEKQKLTSEYEGKIVNLTYKMGESNTHIESLEEQLSESRALTQKYEKKAATLANEAAELAQKNVDTADEMMKVQYEKTAQALKQCAEDARTISSLRNEINELEKQVEQTRSIKVETEAKLAENVVRLKTAETDRMVKEDKVKAQQEIEDLKESDWQAKLDAAFQENENLRVDVTQAEADLANMFANLEEFRVNGGQKDVQISELKAQLARKAASPKPSPRPSKGSKLSHEDQQMLDDAQEALEQRVEDTEKIQRLEEEIVHLQQRLMMVSRRHSITVRGTMPKTPQTPMTPLLSDRGGGGVHMAQRGPSPTQPTTPMLMPGVQRQRRPSIAEAVLGFPMPQMRPESKGGSRPGTPGSVKSMSSRPYSPQQQRPYSPMRPGTSQSVQSVQSVQSYTSEQSDVSTHSFHFPRKAVPVVRKPLPPLGEQSVTRPTPSTDLVGEIRTSDQPYAQVETKPTDEEEPHHLRPTEELEQRPPTVTVQQPDEKSYRVPYGKIETKQVAKTRSKQILQLQHGPESGVSDDAVKSQKKARSPSPSRPGRSPSPPPAYAQFQEQGSGLGLAILGGDKQKDMLESEKVDKELQKKEEVLLPGVVRDGGAGWRAMMGNSLVVPIGSKALSKNKPDDLGLSLVGSSKPNLSFHQRSQIMKQRLGLQK